MYRDVDWSEREAHMHERHGVAVEQAEEALADPNRIVFEPDYASISGKSVRVVGYSASANRVLTVIVVIDDEGKAWGGSAWPANTKDHKASMKGREMTKITELIASEVAAAEAADDTDTPLPPQVRVTRGHDRTRVLQVRLSEEEFQELARRADAHDVPASTLARDVLLRNLTTA